MALDFAPEPDLYPLYPNTAQLAVQLSSQSGLSPQQKSQLIAHCLSRACVFADISVLQYLLVDPHAQAFVDLSVTDEEQVGLVSLTIHGFGSDSERDVEREECVRLLIQQGASVSADSAGWTPLHYAALLCPPTLISHLVTHDCSPFAQTKRGLTPLDIITAHTMLPGREDVAMLLEAAMRGDGWTGGRMEEKRRLFDQRMKRRGKRKDVRDDIGRILEVNPRWWVSEDEDWSSEVDSDDEEETEPDHSLFTPPTDYSSMLVFAPDDLPAIFDSIITNFSPSICNSQPANTLYLLARFACLTCDHTWLEELLLGATDAIEEAFFSRSEDITSLVFWLYNTTLWLHLLQCDSSINEACEMLGASELIEELINSLFVFIIRFAERKIDQLLDNCLLEHAPLASEFDSVQFESDWSIFRPFTSGKRKPVTPSPSTPSTLRSAHVSPPNSPGGGRPPSPSASSIHNLSSSTSSGPFSSLRQSFAKSKASSTTPLQSLFVDPASPADVTSFLSALHTLLTLSEINPALITQLWSQVLYWTSCEMFNRILTRKKYLCRSRAMQIGMNLSTLEEWVIQMGLPRGVQSHFNPVRDLLNWLQCLSSITEFPDLIATIQNLKHINPLQMRRALRDYKYEVNEGRMTEECTQYLVQLQKDWERHRVKLGVEALRKEMVDKDRDTDSVSSANFNEPLSSSSRSIHSVNTVETLSSSPSNIDMLFEHSLEKNYWEPVKPPVVLGELLDSRHMLPLALPSNPVHLAALPGPLPFTYDDDRIRSATLAPDSRSTSRASSRSGGTMSWRTKTRRVRELDLTMLQRIDGTASLSRWVLHPEEEVEEDLEEDDENGESLEEQDEKNETLRIETRFTPLARKMSRKARASHGGDVTPVETE